MLVCCNGCITIFFFRKGKFNTHDDTKTTVKQNNINQTLFNIINQISQEQPPLNYYNSSLHHNNRDKIYKYYKTY